MHGNNGERWVLLGCFIFCNKKWKILWMPDGNKDMFVSAWACCGRPSGLAGGNITFYGWQTQKIVVYWNSSGLLTSCNNKKKTPRRQPSRSLADFNLASTSAPCKTHPDVRHGKQCGDFFSLSFCSCFIMCRNEKWFIAGLICFVRVTLQTEKRCKTLQPLATWALHSISQFMPPASVIEDA